MEFYAVASKGTEEALRDELCELGFKSVRLNRGGIPFRGEWQDGWRACLHSRIAQRIQVVLKRCPVKTEQQLYNEILDIDWQKYLTPEKTLSISAFCCASNLTHSGFIGLKAKDAVVDKIRQQCNERPSIDRTDADVRIFVYLANNKLTLYLDLSGDSLFRRGYRSDSGEAPLKETLAAAMLRISGWDRSSPLLDPMCGSGTIAIEAALWAANIAPGLARKQFGFERWANFDEQSQDTLRTMRGEARRMIIHNRPRIIASDIDPQILKIAESNAKKAGVRIKFKQSDVCQMHSDNNSKTIISNPPYGKRLATNQRFFQQLGGALERQHNSRVCILSGDADIEKNISTTAKKIIKVNNGSLPCNIILYDII